MARITFSCLRESGFLSVYRRENSNGWFDLVYLDWHLGGVVGRNLHEGGGFGILGNLIVGVIGAIVGGLVFGLLGFESTNILGSLITATVGAILFIALLRVIKQA